MQDDKEFKPSEWAYFPADLDTCESALRQIREEHVHLGPEEMATVAGIILEFYRQGIRDSDDLRSLALGARGLNLTPRRHKA